MRLIAAIAFALLAMAGTAQAQDRMELERRPDIVRELDSKNWRMDNGAIYTRQADGFLVRFPDGLSYFQKDTPDQANFTRLWLGHMIARCKIKDRDYFICYYPDLRPIIAAERAARGLIQ